MSAPVTPGGVALDWAIQEWGRVVREPAPGRPRGAHLIDGYIRGALGLGWPSAATGPGDSQAYERNGQFEWCGAFAARAWGAAGLDAEVRRLRLPSTYRLGSTEARHGPPLLRVPLDRLQPGDVLVVTDGRKAWGTHVTLVQAVRPSEGLVFTVEGNARGKLGDGSVGEGVVLRTRPLAQGAAAGQRCPVSGLPQSLWAQVAYRPTPAMLRPLSTPAASAAAGLPR